MLKHVDAVGNRWSSEQSTFWKFGPKKEEQIRAEVSEIETKATPEHTKWYLYGERRLQRSKTQAGRSLTGRDKLEQQCLVLLTQFCEH